MKLKSKVIRIIVYSKICILTQTHDDGKKTQNDKNEVKVAGLVVGWYQRCSVDLFSGVPVVELKVEGSENHVCAREAAQQQRGSIAVCEPDSYCLAGGAVLLICNVMHTVGNWLFGGVDVRSLQYCVAPHEKIAASRAARM